MKAQYVQRGEAIDYINGTEATIEYGDVVIIGRHIGVAAADILPGETGVLVVTGVFELPKKASEVLAVGDNVTFDATNGISKATDTTVGDSGAVGTDVHGYAVAAAEAADEVALVKLMG